MNKNESPIDYIYLITVFDKLDYGLYPWAEERWFYKYNRETGRYEEIDEPVFIKDRGPVGGIG